MQNPQNIAENIVSFERRFYEINPQGDFLVSLVEFCCSFTPLWPSHFSIAISDKEKFITCLMGEHLKLPLKEGQEIEDYWKIRQVISTNEVQMQSSNTFGFDFNQIVVPLHTVNGAPMGSFSLFYRPNFQDSSGKADDFRNELVQAINVGMQPAVIFRYLAEKINQLLSADLVLFTEFDNVAESFFSISEFKFDGNVIISDNSDREQLANGHRVYKHILDNAQCYISRSIEIPDLQSAPFKSDPKQTFVVAPIISKDRVIGTINVGFRNKSVIDKRTVSLIEEVAGYISIFLNQDILVKSLDENMKKVKETEHALHKLEEKKSVRDITTESMSDAREQLIQLVRNLYVLCENPSSEQATETLCSIVGHLQQMTSRIVQFESMDYKITGRGVVDIKSQIDEILLEAEEELIKQNLITRNIIFVNRMTVSGAVELNTNEFRSVLNNVLFSLVKKSQEESKIYFESRTINDLMIISIRNFETDLLSVQQPGRTARLHKNSELVFKLAGMLFNMNHIEFNIDSVSDTEFKFEIMLKLVEPPVMVLPDKQWIKSSQTQNDQFHILIVDDDDSLRELMVDILESRNFIVVCFGEAMSAIEEFRRQKYDLVITDYGLPRISGIEFAAKIKEMKPAVPVIMVTGWGSEMDLTKEQNSQIDFVLSKPFNLIDLLGIVENSLKLLKP